MSIEIEKLYYSSDIWKHRNHIHYLLRKNGEGNSVAVCATYNTNKDTLTIKLNGMDLVDGALEEFIKLVKEKNKD